LPYPSYDRYRSTVAQVLVVEDDADSRDALCKMLTRKGYAVDCVGNGRAALLSVLKSIPDVVVLDLSLPEMDGAKLLEIMRSYLRLQSLPVIVWTGMIGNPIVDRATEFHVEAVIGKGKSDFSDLLAAVRHTLESSPQKPGEC